MFCAQCGGSFPAEANFCSRCGAPNDRVACYEFGASGPRVVLRYLAPGEEPHLPKGPALCRHCGARLPAGAAYCERCGCSVGGAPAVPGIMIEDSSPVLLLKWTGEQVPDLVAANGCVSGHCGVDPNDPQHHQLLLARRPICFACGAVQEPDSSFCEQCGRPLELFTIKSPDK